MIKKTTVLKALSMMDEEKVSQFLDNECRGFDEIIDAISDELEKDYIYFMVELYEMMDKLKKEESKNNNGKLSDLVKSDSVTLVKNGTFTDEQHTKIYEMIKDMKDFDSAKLPIPEFKVPNVMYIKRD